MWDAYWMSKSPILLFKDLYLIILKTKGQKNSKYRKNLDSQGGIIEIRKYMVDFNNLNNTLLTN